jgi:hypothetical protein
MIAMFLAAVFGMMALLSIQLEEVIPPLGRLLNPSAGGEAPGGTATTPPPFSPPGRTSITGASSPDEAGLLGELGTPPGAPSTDKPGKNHHGHKPPKPPAPPVDTSSQTVVVQSQTISAGSKGVTPPPDPTSRPKKNDQDVVANTDPAPTKDDKSDPIGGGD